MSRAWCYGRTLAAENSIRLPTAWGSLHSRRVGSLSELGQPDLAYPWKNFQPEKYPHHSAASGWGNRWRNGLYLEVASPVSDASAGARKPCQMGSPRCSWRQNYVSHQYRTTRGSTWDSGN